MLAHDPTHGSGAALRRCLSLQDCISPLEGTHQADVGSGGLFYDLGTIKSTMYLFRKLQPSRPAGVGDSGNPACLTLSDLQQS